ncbi:hypothetical protein K443DRAFT_593439 [Laccaria amethystina LaAM-08-1]|uniref:Uncharacterized protein n=1 Tax=Laccaria amethystina LaAM-08-1 TaxID=1095629 RepID=A0A0C9XYE0_9AGAR|nr:hypothetical protein K443DRAFT_593439 [Laccaria amethystina LaAM-08-1]
MYSVNWLPNVNTASKIMEEGRIGAIERGKEGSGKCWSSPIRYSVLNGWGRPVDGFRERDRGGGKCAKCWV